MSVKDTRYFRECPICSDNLIGTDDGVEVFLSLEEQVQNPEDGAGDPCCTLCGETCSMAEAIEIVAKGEPKLQNSLGNDEDDDDDF